MLITGLGNHLLEDETTWEIKWDSQGDEASREMREKKIC